MYSIVVGIIYSIVRTLVAVYGSGSTSLIKSFSAHTTIRTSSTRAHLLLSSWPNANLAYSQSDG